MAYKRKEDAIRYNNEYIKQTYDRINLTVPKGQKDTIQAHAAARGESVNGFINRAISETIEREQAEMNETTPEA
ncbi:MAG: hypothetical protein ACI3VS_05155 [Evtepia sp.]